MGKGIRYCLPVCIIPLILVSCHIETGWTGSDGTQTVRQEEYSWTDGVQASNLPDISADKETSVNVSDPEISVSEYVEGVESQGPESNFVLPESDRRLYTWEELETLTPEQLRYARNEIYARHGRRFKDDTLQAYFQSKAWYQGTSGPDVFDEGQLNQTERDNVSLLSSLELDRKKNTQMDGADREDSADRRDSSDRRDSARIPIHTGYADIVNKNQYRRLYLEAGEWSDADGQIRSQVIDCGGYYEVTNGCILADTCYPRSVMDNKHVGDTLQLGDALYRIETVDDLDLKDRGSVYLEYVSGSGEAEFMGYYLLARAGGEDFYILVGEDADTQTDTLYTGSLYFSKDCITRVNNPDDSFRSHTVSISDYLTRDKKTVGAQFGLYPSGELVLRGGFDCDSPGLIISYGEAFLP